MSGAGVFRASKVTRNALLSAEPPGCGSASPRPVCCSPRQRSKQPYPLLSGPNARSAPYGLPVSSYALVAPLVVPET